jgi:hypothetical protein
MQTFHHATILSISTNNSTDIFYKKMKFEKGQTYLCLGFTGMQDGIVLVDDDGRIFELAYDEEDFDID